MWRNPVTVTPLLEPLTLDEVKDHRRITTSDQDADLDRLITATREYAESDLSLALLTQTRVLYLDRWPRNYDGRIYLPRPPLQSVTSVQYKEATAGTLTTLTVTTDYVVYGATATPGKSDHQHVGYIVPAYGVSWPSLYPVPENVVITYVCGWKTIGAIPEAIRQGMLLKLGQQDENREPDVTGTIVASVNAIESLWATHRCYHEFGEYCG